jgi:tetratricopeptide (TPR) repeat protein
MGNSSSLSTIETEVDRCIGLAFRAHHEGRMKKARKAIGRALERAPLTAEQYNSLGIFPPFFSIDFLGSLFANCFLHLDLDSNCILRDKDFFVGSQAVGIALLHMGDTKQAKETFQKAIETDPDFYYAYLFLGHAFEKERDYFAASAIYMKAIGYDYRAADVHLPQCCLIEFLSLSLSHSSSC